MVLLYSAACAAVLSWRLRARLRAWFAKRAYEKVESEFREVERTCKLDEVQLGRPVDYAGQLRLLKAFEARERQKSRWTSAVQSLAGANRAWTSLRGFQGRRTSYLSGVLDVGLLWYGHQKLTQLAEFSAQANAWVDAVKRIW
jgi:hypothetical protein